MTGCIYQWRKAARAKGQLPPENSAEPEGWSTQDKFNALLETAALSEAELAEYCRRRGLYPEQIQRWRASCEQANDLADGKARDDAEAVKTERKRSKELERELRRKEAALAGDRRTADAAKKSQCDLGGRGRMTSSPGRIKALVLVGEAREAGARQMAACAEIGIDTKTYRAWQRDAEGDRRPTADRPPQPHALTPEEKNLILEACHRPEFASLPPAQIVTRLLDEEGRYIASESSFCRVLRAENEQQRRGREAAPRHVGPLRRHEAKAPNEVLSWEVTYLPTPVRGLFYYLYLIVDLYSRKIVGFEVFHGESAANSQQVIERALLREGIAHRPTVLHGDNGPAMKAATLTARLEQLGVMPSVQPTVPQRRQPLLRGAVPDLQVPPGLPAQRIHGHPCSP